MIKVGKVSQFIGVDIEVIGHKKSLNNKALTLFMI